jgi:hypothetical protein
MSAERFEVHYPRSASVIAIVLFVVALTLWIDYGFLHTIRFTVPVEQRGGPIFWLVFLGIILSLAMTVKTVISPSLIFAADREGVELGRGVFMNRVQRIPWSKVRHLHVDTFGMKTARHDDVGVHLTFADDVELSRVGYPISRRDSEHVWEIRNSVFSEPPEAVITRLESLRSSASSASKSHTRRA